MSVYSFFGTFTKLLVLGGKCSVYSVMKTKRVSVNDDLNLLIKMSFPKLQRAAFIFLFNPEQSNVSVQLFLHSMHVCIIMDATVLMGLCVEGKCK